MVEDTTTKVYTLEEVSKQNGKSEKGTVWIIIKDNVYDVTDYLDEHPGGKETIMEFAGKDATKDFVAAGHSGDAKKELKSYKIGEIVEEERKKKTKKADNTVAVYKNDKIKDVETEDAQDSAKNRRSCISIITCGLCKFS
ncbi:unnamed protein product [Phaedon cochleariae]|uniref:Cytochrome b5 n=1 Tax=Phaedon cochleariae TaxID=80249 RepID=A0A9P0GVR6_PHACE|nr:unnamed protein product [Phaedon cochleariae]